MVDNDGKSGLCIATINVHGMTYDKIYPLVQFIQDYPLHLLILTETHKASIPSWMSFAALPNAIHRLGTSLSGGVSIFSSIPITERSQLLSHNENALACEINTPAGPRIVIGMYYFNDNDDVDDPRFNMLIDNISNVINKSTHPVIFAGDFNMKHPNWSSDHLFPPGSSVDSQASLFRDTLAMNDLYVLNTVFPGSSRLPTHNRGNTLDLIITNTPRSFSSCAIVENTTIGIHTDHHMVYATIPSPHRARLSRVQHPTYYTTALPRKWIVKRADWKLFRFICNAKSTNSETVTLFQSIFDGTQHDANSMYRLWSHLSSLILSAAEAAVPTCPRNKHYRTHWWDSNPDIPSLHQRYMQLLRRYRRHKYSIHTNQYRREYYMARNAFRDA